MGGLQVKSPPTTHELQGVNVAAITSRGKAGDVNFGATFELIDYLCAARVDGIALFTAWGEYPALASDDRARLLYLAVKRSRVPVLAGVGSATLDQTLDLAREARHPLLIVNDSDISVPAGYIGDVTRPLSDPSIGLVTCLYRAEAHDWPSRFEALAIATDFAPSTLEAQMFGVSDFGLCSTLAFRRADLDRIGGFSAIADYLADDYQLGHKLHALGLRNVISEVVVSTRLSSGSWLGAWRHQVRWARTIRLSGGAGAGYAGLPITCASLWAAIAALAGLWWIAMPLLAIRFAMARVCGGLLLGSADVWKYFYAIPVRDLAGVAVWAAGLFGRTVIWRDQQLKLDGRGRIASRSNV